MVQDPTVENSVYDRYGLKWADLPELLTPSSHADEMELFCAKQSMAVYGVYPNVPHAPKRDYIPSKQREAISARTFALGQMIEGAAEAPTATFEAEQGYRIVLSNYAAALLVWKQQNLVVAFRGTANWQDWIHNFTDGLISTDLVDLNDDIKLHKGFTGLSENIAPAVKELISEFLQKRGSHNPPPILTICGHSLGGAIAINFTARLNRWFDNDHLFDHNGRHRVRLGATYTFGAPRIGKGRVWQFIRRPHYRLVLRGDPVPSTPISLTDDFQAAYLEKPSGPVSQPNNALQKILKGAWTKVKPTFDFSAHDIESYVDAIQMKIAAKKRPAISPKSP